MNHRHNPFQILADQAKRGDLAAKAQLHQLLEPQMVHVVRQTLQWRRERTPIERTIFAAARQLGLERPRTSLQEQEFIRQVAGCVFSQVMASIHPGQDSGFLSAETVADFAAPAVRRTA